MREGSQRWREIEIERKIREKREREREREREKEREGVRGGGVNKKKFFFQ